jgi:hypothetical protein
MLTGVSMGARALCSSLILLSFRGRLAPYRLVYYVHYTMTTDLRRQHLHRRAEKTVALVNLLDRQIPPGHPARATVRELIELYDRKTPDIRALLERVPGASLAAKGAKIGLSRGTVWALWHGKFTPSEELIDAIRYAGDTSIDDA